MVRRSGGPRSPRTPVIWNLKAFPMSSLVPRDLKCKEGRGGEDSREDESGGEKRRVEERRGEERREWGRINKIESSQIEKIK